MPRAPMHAPRTPLAVFLLVATVSWVTIISGLTAASPSAPSAVQRLAQRGHGDAGGPFVAPGPCVPIPEREFTVQRTSMQSSPPDPSYPNVHQDRVSMGTSRGLDIDGDGQPDALVPEPRAGDCVSGYHLAVYIVRGTCGHRVGVIEGFPDVVSPATAPRRAGLPDLVTTIEHGRQPDPRAQAQMHRETVTYRFDGTEYREVARATQDTVCPHCPTQHCESTPASHQ